MCIPYGHVLIIKFLVKWICNILGLVKFFILYLPQWQLLDFGIKMEVVMAFEIKKMSNKPSQG